MTLFFAINLIVTIFAYMRFHTQVATKILRKNGGTIDVTIITLVTISWIIFYHLNSI
jgi:hypothetical protein